MEMYIDNDDVSTLLLEDEEDFIFSRLKPRNNNKRTDDVFEFRKTECFHEVLINGHLKNNNVQFREFIIFL